MSGIAHHLYCAGRLADPGRTARALIAAGDAAHAMYATEEAVQHYRRALEVLQETSGDESGAACRRRKRLADLLALLGDRAAAMEHYDSVSGGYRTARATVDQARIARKIGTLHWQAGDRAEAMACYRRALEQLSGSTAHIEAAHLYQELGLAAFRSGDNQQAIEWSERALQSAERALAEPGGDAGPSPQRGDDGDRARDQYDRRRAGAIGRPRRARASASSAASRRRGTSDCSMSPAAPTRISASSTARSNRNARSTCR